MIPGEIFYKDEEIVLNKDKRTIQLVVTNIGDRAVQIGSHFHFFEVNKCLEFDRKKAFGYKLDIPAGNAIRFEPGQSHKINLTQLGGKCKVMGFNGLVNGDVSDQNVDEILEKMIKLGFANKQDKESGK
ncbi:urease subunit beta [Campylobacter pinnipediorum]|uniref:Urease subunit beta n=1 Tax=Campylobacter pinnipediorum subsp. pinnipediorum TaxID=1660067 RepID=A0AAX0L8J6_9BACT|nr:urease subunit beta [Campylobacter pinnipediorum]AQW80817.1 urease, beta subunit [Campylobacter pinnipediorum subsp. pinnipediorum]AQW82437.1 urease, beta subunit [Campylobacter pinnipediorum subsp. pinnipediorum]AQW84107.1 urease, beta subunit [Campylobacter pinnipediorum subsp. pinnipediorum]OPA74481.1 urease subunit beta [Campylobacter pinnipediorum subsp. pinnipediorum]OPA74819.1 urease subunit beta [Campylobacter pinnipediorum subsp. pinnipediorum]